jgi:hypothetical protein
MQVHMSTNSNQPEDHLGLTELLKLLIKHFGVHEGLFDLAVQFHIGTGAMRSKTDGPLPGAIVGFAGVGLRPVTKAGPNTLDAAKVNPEASQTATRKRSTAANRKRKTKRKRK